MSELRAQARLPLRAAGSSSVQPGLREILVGLRQVHDMNLACGAEEEAHAEALARSRGGFLTEILVRAEGIGTPMTFVLPPDQQQEPRAYGWAPFSGIDTPRC